MLRTPFRAAERLSLTNIQNEVSTLLERLWHSGLSTGPLDGQDLAPPVEVTEEPDRYLIYVELPGVAAGSVDITAGQMSLSIAGEKAPVAAPAGAANCSAEAPAAAAPRTLQNERRYGRFHRIIDLPSSILVDQVTAAIKDGLLTVVLPKSAGAVGSTVRVRVQE